MKTIWKFNLEVTDNQNILMPIGAEILTVQLQDNVPALWAIVDTEQVKESRHFEIFGTGHPMHEDMGVSRKYLNTFQLPSGLVFHVFEYTGV